MTCGFFFHVTTNQILKLIDINNEDVIYIKNKIFNNIAKNLFGFSIIKLFSIIVVLFVFLLTKYTTSAITKNFGYTTPSYDYTTLIISDKRYRIGIIIFMIAIIFTIIYFSCNKSNIIYDFNIVKQKSIKIRTVRILYEIFYDITTSPELIETYMKYNDRIYNYIHNSLTKEYINIVQLQNMFQLCEGYENNEENIERIVNESEIIIGIDSV